MLYVSRGEGTNRRNSEEARQESLLVGESNGTDSANHIEACERENERHRVFHFGGDLSRLGL